MTDTWAIDGTKANEYAKLDEGTKWMREYYGAKFLSFSTNFNSPYEPYTEEERFQVDNTYDMEKQYWADQWDLLMERERKDIGPYWGLLRLHKDVKGFCEECSSGDEERSWPCGTAKYGMKWDRNYSPKWTYPKRRLKSTEKLKGEKTGNYVTYPVHLTRSVNETPLD